MAISSQPSSGARMPRQSPLFAELEEGVIGEGNPVGAASGRDWCIREKRRHGRVVAAGGRSYVQSARE